MEFPEHPPAAPIRERLHEDCARLESLLRGLLDPKRRIAKDVHAIRKLGKSLRGGFFLIGLQKTAGREIQAIGRLLSGSRDAVSRLKTWTRLGWAESPDLDATISALLKQSTRSADRRPPPVAVAWAVERAIKARTILDETGDEILSRNAGIGIAKLFQKLEKRCRKLAAQTDSEFHETRKALKAFLGALDILPHAPKPDRAIDKLAELLGDENDLATLSEWLEAHGFSERIVPDLWNHLEKHRTKLQRQAREDAAAI